MKVELTTKITPEFIESRPVSYSRLKHFRTSPKDYVYSFQKKKETDAMYLGDIVDSLLIHGEDDFNLRYQPYSNFEKRTKEAKQLWADMQEKAKAEKKRLVTTEMVEQAQDCVRAIKEYPDAKPFLNMRRRHPFLNWRDRETKLPCVAAIDWDCMLDNNLFIVDLKVTKDSDPDDMGRFIVNGGVYMQVGSYLEAYKNTAFQFPTFVFIAINPDDLHNISINIVDNKYAEFCREEFLGTLKAFRYCLDNDLWHMGYEFRLFGTREYFSLSKPGWLKPLFGAWSE